MRKEKYRFREGAILALPNLKRASPQLIGDALSVIKKKNGRLTPHLVVDAARSPRNVLHKFFEWNDAKAAEIHRRYQARTLIQSVDVIYGVKDRSQVSAFLSITSDKQGPRYFTPQEVQASEQLRIILLKSGLRDLLAWEARYGEIKDICSIVVSARKKLSKRVAVTETRMRRGGKRQGKAG